MSVKNKIFINLPIILIFSFFLIIGIIIYDDMEFLGMNIIIELMALFP